MPEHSARVCDQSPRPRAFPVSGALVALLTALPFLWLVLLVARYSVDLPFYDQWDFVPLLKRSLHGPLPLREIWAHNAEHRLFFSRLILLLLARVTSWNTRAELVANLLLAALTLAVLAGLQRRAAREAGITGPPWSLPLLSLLVFGLPQIENWLWGWQMSYFLCVLGVVAGIALLTSPRATWGKFAGAVAAGLLASYSFASGLPYWPIGLLAVALTPAATRRQHALRLGLWALASALAIAVYFHGYHPPAWHPGIGAARAHPWALAEFVSFLLGFPVGSHHPPRVGLLGLLTVAGALVVLVRFCRLPRRVVLPFGLLALYACVTVLLIGLGRIGFGLQHTLSARYLTFSYLLWVAVVSLLSLVTAGPRGGLAPQSHRALRAAAAVALACIAVGGVRASWEAAPGYAAVYRLRSDAREALLSGRDSPALDQMLDSRTRLEARAAELRALHLSLFREPERR